MKDNIMIGSRIRNIRESMSLTREQFSELIDISPSFLSQLERGDKSMSIETLMLISLKSGFSCDYVLFGDTNNCTFLNKIDRMLSNSSDDVVELVYNMIRPLSQYTSK